MQVTSTFATLAGEANICNDDEVVVFNGADIRPEEARALADALYSAATRAEHRRATRKANYDKATQEHALQLLASVQ
jgi:hypothetical protein